MNANPILFPVWFQRSRVPGWAGRPMDMDRVVLCTLGLLVLCTAAAALAWSSPAASGAAVCLWGAAATGAAAAAVRWPRRAGLAGAVFAAAAGTALGGLTHPDRAGIGGWATVPVLVSFGMLLAMLLASRAGRDRIVSPAGVALLVLFGLALTYTLSAVAGSLGAAAPRLSAAGWGGAGVATLLGAAVAVSLALDLDALEAEALIGVPLSMTGQAALGLLAGSLWGYVGAPLAAALWVWSRLQRRLEAAPRRWAAHSGSAMGARRVAGASPYSRAGH